MNLLEKIEAALDSATPPMSDLLRECESYVRAAGECEELLLIAHMDGYHKGKEDGQKVPDGMQLVPVDATPAMIKSVCDGYAVSPYLVALFYRKVLKIARRES